MLVVAELAAAAHQQHPQHLPDWSGVRLTGLRTQHAPLSQPAGVGPEASVACLHRARSAKCNKSKNNCTYAHQ